MQISFLIPIIVSALGLLLLFRLRFFFLLHPIRTAKEIALLLTERDNRRSLFLALAGTLGVGSVFGVASGIIIGGGGVLFWLALSSVFSMVIKYSETLLVFDSPLIKGGMCAVCESAFPKFGRIISTFYAMLTVLLSLFMGCALQSSAVSDLLFSGVGISPFLSSFFVLILLSPCFFGGVKRIQNITEFIIPLTTLTYIIMCLFVIVSNISILPDTLQSIIIDAFDIKSAAVGGMLIALKEGFARGILSNEAGVGTSALSHSLSRGRTPREAGLFGIVEVFFDTDICCLLTGFAILTSVDDPSSFSSPMSLVFSAFSDSLGNLFASLLIPITLSFAYATLICWYYYGIELSSLLSKRLKAVYPIFFVTVLMLSSKIPTALLLASTDILLLFMALITSALIVKNHKRIAQISNR